MVKNGARTFGKDRKARVTPIRVIFVGGGLANVLACYRLAQLRPEVSSLIVESGPTLGGNHTWSFHDADLHSGDWQWMNPLLSKSWNFQRLEFNSLSRKLSTAYHSIRSEKFHEVTFNLLKNRVRLNTAARSVESQKVILADGTTLLADCVVDGRGWDESNFTGLAVGYQKFFGQVVTLEKPHGLSEPVLMDARCSQSDGFRFFYLLPFSAHQCLIEDTRYSESNLLDTAQSKRDIESYCEQRNWAIVAEAGGHCEEGVLPIPWSGELRRRQTGPILSGVRAGLFHATTGYSLAEAVKFASLFCKFKTFDYADVFPVTRAHAETHWKGQRFFRLLNRMMFQAAEPSQRFRIFEKFYRLPATTVERFYASQLKLSDQARIFWGKPPVPVLRAIRSVMEN
jgi:lycopene beta-cyclase